MAPPAIFSAVNGWDGDIPGDVGARSRGRCTRRTIPTRRIGTIAILDFLEVIFQILPDLHKLINEVIFVFNHGPLVRNFVRLDIPVWPAGQKCLASQTQAA
jgi:hypothetical protein